MTEQPQTSVRKKPSRIRRWAKIGALIIGALVLLAFLAASALMLWGSRRIKREIEAVRALNEPTNWDELLRTDRQGHVLSAADNTAEREAASLYAQALAEVKEWDKMLPKELSGKLGKEALSPEEVQQLGEALSHYQEAIGLLRKASTYDGIVNLPEASATDDQKQIDSLMSLREAARLLQAQAYCAASQGRGDEAADLCVLMLRNARSFPGYNELAGMIHLGNIGVACRTIERTQIIAPSSAEGLDSLSSTLVQSLDDTPMTRMFCGERVCGNYLFFQSVKEKAPRFFMWPNQAAYLELLRKTVAASREPFPASLRTMEQVRGQYAPTINPRTMFCIFATMLAPTLDVSLIQGAETQARVRATLVNLAIRRARFDGAPLPASPQELVPKYLSVIPTDPFTGEPLRYRVDETGCSIYSVGRNGVDDGGTLDVAPGSGNRIEKDIVVHLPR